MENTNNLYGEIFDKKVEDLGLSESTITLLKGVECNTVFDILRIGEDRLMEECKYEEKTRDEIINKLASYGLDYQKESADIKMIFDGYGKGGIDFLKQLPDKYFADKSPEFLVIDRVVYMYLKNFVEISGEGAVTQIDFDKIKKEFLAKNNEYKELVIKKRTSYNLSQPNMKVKGKRAKMIDDEWPYFHHNPTQKTHEGHAHNPFSNERSL